MAALFASVLLNAQGEEEEVRNKKGHLVLPEKGDIALGFNTIPVLDVLLGTLNFGGTFPGASDMVQYTSYANNQIMGKYFLDGKTAVRVRLGINTLSGSITNQVQDAEAMHNASLGTADDIQAASLLRVDDKMTFRKNNMLLSVGLEKRRGHQRLQGFYGAELGVGNEGGRQTVDYGNAFSDLHDVYFTNFGSSISTVSVNPIAPGRTTRVTETNYRGGFRVGLRGFIGIEYFIFAKISIAAEYGWGYSIATRRAAKSTREVYNNGENGPQVFTEEVDIDSREVLRGFSVDNNSGSAFSMTNTLSGNTSLNGGAGSLTLLFHF